MTESYESLLMVEASAGSGKTYQLVRRYINLLANGARADSILATTFSRKAAQEIFERIVLLLLECVEEESAAKELSHFLGKEGLKANNFLELLTNFLGELSSLPIGTLDSFAQKVARLFSENLNLPEEWAIPSLTEERYLEEEALRRVLLEHSEAERKELLSLVTSHDASRSVFSRLFGRITRLKGLARDTEESAWWWDLSELGLKKDKDGSQFLERAPEVSLPTTKAGAPDKRWEKAHGKSQYSFEQKEWKEFLKSGVPASLLDGKEKFSGKEISPECRELYESATRHATYMLGVELIRRTQIVRGFLSRYLTVLFDLKYRSQRFGFDEIKGLLGGALSSFDSHHLAYRLDRRLGHLLIDEFQDTTRSEWEMLSALSDEVAAAPSDDRSLFIVGDPKQSIYGWRGALPELFQEVKEAYPHLVLSTLEKSYRSSPVVIQFVNEVFSTLGALDALEGHRAVTEKWLSGFSEHSSAREELPGFVEVKQYVDEEEYEEVPGEVAATIQGLFEKNPTLSVAVLVRTNKQILPYVLACEQLGLAVSAEGGSSIVDSPVVVGVLQLLHLIAHPADTLSAYHVESTPLGEWLSRNGEDREVGLASLKRRIEEEGFSSLIREAVSSFEECSERRDEHRSRTLLQMAIQFDQLGERDIDRFIQHVRSEQVEDGEAGIVRVMTMHKSKGLEFDAVFLPECNYAMDSISGRDVLKGDGKVILYADKTLRAGIPRLQKMYEESVSAQVREELSILYVGLTRARSALYLSLYNSSGKKLTPQKLLSSQLRLEEEGVWSSGDSDWVRKLELGEEEESGEEATLVTAPLELTSREFQRVRFFPMASPPSTIRAEEDFVHNFSSEQRGSFIHAVCEQIEWVGEQNPLGEEEIERLGIRFGFTFEEAKKLTEEVEEKVKREEFSLCFRKESYEGVGELQLFPELPFSFIEDGRIVSGVIDRALVARRADGLLLLRVFDIKTGYRDETAQGLQELFSHQLTVYRKAMERLFPEDGVTVESYLCLIDRGELIQIS